MSDQEYVTTVTKDHGNFRIDKFLSAILPISRTVLQKAIVNGSVLINKLQAKCNDRVQDQDEVIAHLPLPVEDHLLIPESTPLQVVYEDDQVLVLNKPTQMVVHPDENHRIGTLANALAYHYKNLPIKDNRVTRPGLVHRLDKDTSGLLVVAKTMDSMASLAHQFYAHTVERSYYTLVWGNPKQEQGTIDFNVSKRMYHQKDIAVDVDNPQGKKAITHYEVIKRFNYVTLVACKLETGRTHQVRIHMQQMGHPVFGDTVYGGNVVGGGQRYASYKAFVRNCFKLMPHQALHAASLAFIHPTTQQYLSFTAPLPENFLKLIEKWENYAACHGR